MNVTNHPLLGQRIRLDGWWVQQGQTFRILGVTEEADGIAALFDINEHRSSSRIIHGVAWIGDGFEIFSADVVRTIYGSRSRNIDPLPYVDGHLDAAGSGRRFAEPYHLDGDGTDCAQCATRLEPREGYEVPPIHPVNPILAWFRAVIPPPSAGAAALWVRDNWSETVDRAAQVGAIDGMTDEHVEHARRVIERLAAL